MTQTNKSSWEKKLDKLTTRVFVFDAVGQLTVYEHELKEFISSLLAQEYKRGEEVAKAEFDSSEYYHTIVRQAQEELIEAIEAKRKMCICHDGACKDRYNLAIDETTAHLRKLVEGRGR